MSAAARALAQRILDASARRVAFLGLAKNAGKTTALVATLAELARQGVVAGATSAGRDGEDFDALTGEPKPRFRLWPDQLVVSAAATFSSATFPSRLLRRLDASTRFGPIELRRVQGEGSVEVIGPTTAGGTARASDALEGAGARVVLLDGAFGRRAFASARVADGVVLAVGMSAARTLEGVLDNARLAVELITLPLPSPGAARREFEGAMTDEALRERPPRAGEVLVAEDFASIFLSEASRRRLSERGVLIGVRRPARLLAVTANPSAPGRLPLPAASFFEALERALPGTPIYDLQADLPTS